MLVHLFIVYVELYVESVGESYYGEGEGFMIYYVRKFIRIK